METFATRLQQLMEERHVSIEALSVRAGISLSGVYKILSGERGNPRRTTIEKLAAGLGVSPTRLMGDDVPCVGHARHEVEFEGEPDAGNIVHVPVIGEIRAGPPLLAIQEHNEYIPVTASEVAGGDFFWYRVRGDSMIGEGIFPGSAVLVRHTPCVASGAIAVVVIDGEEATLKRVRMESDGVVLEAANCAYPDMRFDRRDITIVGEVVEVRRSLRH
jgi:repressor LexA